MTQELTETLTKLRFAFDVLTNRRRRKWTLEGSGVQEAEAMVAANHILLALRLLKEHTNGA